MTTPGGRLAVTPPSAYAAAWRRRSAELLATPPRLALGLLAGDTVLVLGAHPDDETLGLGATIAELASAGVAVHIVSMTAGEAALGHLGRELPELSARRQAEFMSACTHLGAASSTIVGLPDAQLGGRADEVHEVVTALVREHQPAHLVTPWWRDPHDDHAALGQVACRVAANTGCGVSGYPIWAQHWLDPTPLLTEATSVILAKTTPAARDARVTAMTCYSSQTQPLADDVEAVLPPDMLAWDLELLVAP